MGALRARWNSERDQQGRQQQGWGNPQTRHFNRSFQTAKTARTSTRSDTAGQNPPRAGTGCSPPADWPINRCMSSRWPTDLAEDGTAPPNIQLVADGDEHVQRQAL